jgi:hypothetical protein
MAYDQDRDKLIKLFEYKNENIDSSLLLSIMKYGDSKPKLQITRMYSKKNGEKGYAAGGRLTSDEVQFIKENIDQILNLLE